MIAPESKMKALLEVVYWAILDARAAAALAVDKDAATQNEALKRIIALMNIAHNIPHSINRYENWDEARLKLFLKRHDEKWASKGEVSLLSAYDRMLADS